MNQRILILHSNIPENAPPDELDVIHEAQYLQHSLNSIGLKANVSAFPDDLDKARNLIRNENPDLIFNLVETIFGSGRLIHVAPALFDTLGFAYTGCSTDAIYQTSNKLAAKRLLTKSGLPTAEYISLENKAFEPSKGSQFLIKSVWEHASVGIDEKEFKLLKDKGEILEILRNRKADSNESFAEQYIDGREFNISILGSKNGPQVLPFAEIRFLNYPDSKPKVVGYRAKWDEESFEYKNTVRSFDHSDEDEILLRKLKELCLQCWTLFNLNGYARVDFRVDKNGNPYILEINANPCISEDSGFVAACNQAGISQQEMITRIMEDISR